MTLLHVTVLLLLVQDVTCADNEVCQLVPVQCITAPCYPQPQCVPRTGILLHFSRRVVGAKCIVITGVCVCLCVSGNALLRYCMYFSVTVGNGSQYHLVVHHEIIFKSVHGLFCYSNTREPGREMLASACISCVGWILKVNERHTRSGEGRW